MGKALFHHSCIRMKEYAKKLRMAQYFSPEKKNGVDFGGGMETNDAEIRGGNGTSGKSRGNIRRNAGGKRTVSPPFFITHFWILKFFGARCF